jgi:hypothetical protein
VEARREISFRFPVHVIEKIGPVVDRERTGLFESLELRSFKERAWLGQGAGEKKKA